MSQPPTPPDTDEPSPPPRPKIERRKTYIRTDSAPCDLSDPTNTSDPLSLPIPPVATLQRSRTPPSLLSARPSLIDTPETRSLFPSSGGAFVGSLPTLVNNEPDEGFEEVGLNDEGSSSYSTASEGCGGDDRRKESGEQNTKLDTPTPRPPPPPLDAPSTTTLTPLISPHHSFLLTRSGPFSPALDDGLLNLELKKFWEWVLCFCVVNFDLELGQALECVYPPIDFTESERKNISFSAFPDSNSASHVGDSTFTFRMRSGHFTTELYQRQQPPPLAMPSALSGMSGLHPGAGLPVDTDGFTYGYVFFRQQKDTEIRRGYFQKSLVILTPHPWPGLFVHLISELGPRYMDALVEDRQKAGSDLSVTSSAAKTLLETASFSIAAWPSPPSSLSPEVAYYPISLTLPLLGEATRYSFPPTARFAQLFESPKPHTTEAPPSPDWQTPVICTPGKLYELFAGSLELLWVCWELMVVGQSLLVVAESPKACSEIVWGLVELIKPIPFGGDYRPYFTIQDSDFKGIANRQRLPTTAMVIGVTNPVFTKVLEHWPHVIRAARVSHPKMSSDGSTQGKSGGLTPKPEMWSPTLPRAQSPSPTVGRTKNTPNNSPKKPAILTFSKTPKPTPSKDMASPTCGVSDAVVVESITCKHKPYLSKDRKLIKEVVEAAIRGKPVHVLDNMLRRHFIDLTERFIQPLNRHFESLIVGNPLHMTLSNLRTRPEIKPFKQDTFLRTVEQQAGSTNLPVNCKRPLSDLYRAFLLSVNFAAWLQSRTEEVYREWRRRYLDVLCEEDVASWAIERLNGAAPNRVRRRGSTGDVECVDLLLRIRDEVVKYSPYFVDAHVPQRHVHAAQHQHAHMDLASSHGGWAHSLCAAAPGPSSPGPVGVMGGVVPTREQYIQLKRQLEVLVGVLPEGLRGVVVVGGRRGVGG
ncbi:hypothetical protein SpCBS45565_g01383 [Spizellomyces sp. 'palustris']|nr:hypothetical protein SpCBS45565_g01383 [Spizellomyces sp. 'palustris']